MTLTATRQIKNKKRQDVIVSVRATRKTGPTAGSAIFTAKANERAAAANRARGV